VSLEIDFFNLRKTGVGNQGHNRQTKHILDQMFQHAIKLRESYLCTNLINYAEQNHQGKGNRGN